MSDPAPAGPWPAWLTGSDGAVQIRIHAQPGARRTHAVGDYGGRLKIALHAPPVDGKANAELIALVAEHFGVRKADVTIKSGATGRRKLAQIDDD